jgi:hypothetical protein
MTSDNNKVHFLTNVTSLLIPQRMNSFNKEEKVIFVKWHYSGLSFRDVQFRATNSKVEMSNIIHCHFWLSPRLHFPAIIAVLKKKIPTTYIIIQNKWHLGRRWKFKFTLAARPLLIIPYFRCCW